MYHRDPDFDILKTEELFLQRGIKAAVHIMFILQEHPLPVRLSASGQTLSSGCKSTTPVVMNWARNTADVDHIIMSLEGRTPLELGQMRISFHTNGVVLEMEHILLGPAGDCHCRVPRTGIQRAARGAGFLRTTTLERVSREAA